jgi:excisionase family DNA binding protein
MNTVELPQGLKPAYTLNETAALLGVSRATINRLIRAGRLRVARIGWRTVRVTDEAVRDFLRANEETGGVASSGGTRKRFSPLREASGERKQIRKASAERRD